MDLEALRCPGCGGSDLTKTDGGEYVCEHCRTRAVLAPDEHILILAGRRCPDCGFVNERMARFCGKCGSRLTRQCPICGAHVLLKLSFCSSCGHDFKGLAEVLQAIERNGGPEGLDLSERDLSGINLSRDVVEACLYRAREMQPGASPSWWARFGGFNLAGANLEGADLLGADLERAFLQEANLARVNLREAILVGAFMKGASLREANLAGADLEMAYLAEADLQGANLLDASLKRANMSSANLRGAKVSEVTTLAQAKSLAGAVLPGGTRLSRDDWRRELETGWIA